MSERTSDGHGRPADRATTGGFPGDGTLVVVSNREPYVHTRADGEISVSAAVGGLTTALDAVLRAAGGVWVAWGSGDADAAVTDDRGVVRVPPDDPAYRLRRVTLSDDEVANYYYGYCNRVLWPLCHADLGRVENAPDYWPTYRSVNRTFADAVVGTATGDDAVWFHDYHLALAPRAVRDRDGPTPRLLQFWHVPWPTPALFRACPNGPAVLSGLLANDLLGFHTDAYRRRFLACVERFLDGATVDRAADRVEYRGHETTVHATPIGVDAAAIRRRVGASAAAELTGDAGGTGQAADAGRRASGGGTADPGAGGRPGAAGPATDTGATDAAPAERATGTGVAGTATGAEPAGRPTDPEPSRTATGAEVADRPTDPGSDSMRTDRRPADPALPGDADGSGRPAVLAARGVHPDRAVVLGVERMDYVKGVAERLRALEHLWTTRPRWRRAATHVQVTTPARKGIPAYRRYRDRVEAAVERVNDRFGDDGWQPVVHVDEPVARDDLLALYRAADVAVVSSRRDGMNLVAMEYVAANAGADGRLVLSEFAGASELLGEGALLVNPYDVVGLADAIGTALEMDRGTAARRMATMGRQVRRHDVGRWVERHGELLRRHGE